MYNKLLTRLIEKVEDHCSHSPIDDDNKLDGTDWELVSSALGLWEFFTRLAVVGKRIDIIEELTQQKFAGTATQEQMDIMWDEFVTLLL